MQNVFRIFILLLSVSAMAQGNIERATSGKFGLRTSANKLIRPEFDTLYIGAADSIKTTMYVGRKKKSIVLLDENLNEIRLPYKIKAAYGGAGVKYTQVLTNENKLAWINRKGNEVLLKITPESFELTQLYNINGYGRCGGSQILIDAILFENGGFHKLLIRKHRKEFGGDQTIDLFPRTIDEMDEVSGEYEIFDIKISFISMTNTIMNFDENIEPGVLPLNEYFIVQKKARVFDGKDGKSQTALLRVYTDAYRKLQKDTVIGFGNLRFYYEPNVNTRLKFSEETSGKLLYGYYPLVSKAKYSQLNQFEFFFARFALADGKKGWIDLYGNEYIDTQ